MIESRNLAAATFPDSTRVGRLLYIMDSIFFLYALCLAARSNRATFFF